MCEKTDRTSSQFRTAIAEEDAVGLSFPFLSNDAIARESKAEKHGKNVLNGIKPLVTQILRMFAFFLFQTLLIRNRINDVN